tara:strand:+ start:95 stop:628 length:534 start_codon:yes stop_codon:yes gene_type:complete
MSTLKVNEIQNTSGGSDITNVGKVLQIVSATKTDSASGTSTSTPTDITGLSVNITPASASNKVWIVFTVSVSVDGSYGAQGILLVRNSTQICLADAEGNRARNTIKAVGGGASHYYQQALGQNFLDSPNSTSQVTYKLQHVDTSTNNTIYINRNQNNSNDAGYSRSTSTITAIEIAA